MCVYTSIYSQIISFIYKSLIQLKADIQNGIYV